MKKITNHSSLGVLMIASIVLSQVLVPFAVYADEIVVPETISTSTAETTDSHPVTANSEEASSSTQGDVLASSSTDSSVINASSSTETDTSTTSTDMSSHDVTLGTAATSSATSTTEEIHGGPLSLNPNQDISATTTPLNESSTTDAETSATSTGTTSVPFYNNTVFTVILPATTTTATSTNVEIDASTSVTTIKTGNAYAVANILNVANTNMIDSQGSISFANFLGTAGNYDARSSTTTATCAPLLPCTLGSDVTLNTLNTTNIENQFILQAVTGDNTIKDAGSALIQTGNAFAGLSLINLANVNFTNSNYFISIINAFNGFMGNLILPNLSSFFSYSHGGYATSTVSLANDATVSNDATVTAETGNNTTGSSTTTDITSGTSTSITNVVNNINTDITHDNFSLYFKITGAWNGTVYGAPSWLSWERTADGILFTPTVGSSTSISAYPSTLDVHATSSATIHNVGSIDATTGTNAIQNTATGTIRTGDARSVASIINVANTTIIGANWFLGLINIFGDFNGNIYFGEPELPVGLTTVSTTTNPDIGSTATPTATDTTSAVPTASTNYATGGGGSNTSTAVVGNQNNTNIFVNPFTAPKTQALRIQITRSPETITVNGKNRIVHESLSIVNQNNYTQNGVVLDDNTYAPDGSLLDDEHWDIGTIAPYEEVQVTYDAKFSDTAVGIYTLSTLISGTGINTQSTDQNGTIILTGPTVLPIAMTAGKVLGVSTTTISHKPTTIIKRIRKTKYGKVVTIVSKKSPSTISPLQVLQTNTIRGIKTNTSSNTGTSSVGITLFRAISSLVHFMGGGLGY